MPKFGIMEPVGQEEKALSAGDPLILWPPGGICLPSTHPWSSCEAQGSAVLTGRPQTSSFIYRVGGEGKQGLLKPREGGVLACFNQQAKGRCFGSGSGQGHLSDCWIGLCLH